MASQKAHPAERRERAVAMVFEVRAETGNARLDRTGRSSADINTETLWGDLGRPGWQKLQLAPGSMSGVLGLGLGLGEAGQPGNSLGDFVFG